MNRYRLGAVLAMAGLLMQSPAQATDGYFSHGYGMKETGRGGASMGFTDDAFGGANNPASMVWVGNRLDAGLTLFMPIREVKVGFDFQRINYNDIPAVHNPGSNRAPLGSNQGPGFGWQSINVYKVGKASEITGMYMHAFSNNVSGPSAQFGGTETLHMLQNSFGLAYGVRF